MKIMVIPIAIGALGTVPYGLIWGLEIGGEAEIIQTTALLRLEETCCHSNSSERPSVAAMEKLANNNNEIKARIDKTLQNSKCRLYGEKDENINHIINEWSKLTQKEYKTRHDRVGKVIHSELWKKLKFDHTNKWYMHNPTSVPENDTHKLLWGFDIQTDHLTSARRPDLIIINKKKDNLQNYGLCCPD